MTIDDMRFFINLQEYRSYSEACEKMYFSRQGIYKRIKRIESEIGSPLLESFGHRYVLTTQGVSALKAFSTIVVVYYELLNLNGEVSGQLLPYMNYAVTRSVYPQLIPEFDEYLRTLKEEFSGTQIDCVFTTNDECFQYVLDEKVSAGIVLGMRQMIPECWSVLLREYPLYVVMKKGHSLSTRVQLLPDDISMYPCLFLGNAETFYSPLLEMCRRKNEMFSAKDCERDYNYYEHLLDGKTILVTVNKIPEAFSNIYVSVPLVADYHAALLFIGRNGSPFSGFTKKAAEKLSQLISARIG